MLVPRPISSRITRLRGVAVLRMRAVSVISTMNVLWPRASSSLAPTRAKMRSATPIVASRAGTKLPIWAISVSSAAWRMYVLLPAMLGPVMRRSESRDHTVSFSLLLAPRSSRLATARRWARTSLPAR